jgi:DNA-binding CsgD family transcriptional regulator
LSVLKRTPATDNARDALIDRAHGAESVLGSFEAASERLRRLVPYDAAVWAATDPTTNMPTAPTRAENLEERIRSVGFGAIERFWEGEYLEPDFNSFGELARAERPAAGLDLATGGRPARSMRFREVLRAKGFRDELRAVLRVDGVPWASLNLFREQGRRPFDSAEIDLVSRLSAPLGEAIRAHARAPLPVTSSRLERGPGLMVFAAHGELLSANDEALAWLEELPVDGWEKQLRPGSPARLAGLPLVLVSIVMRARAGALKNEGGTSRCRMRAAGGRWLVCHASCLRDSDGMLGNTALVIEPAKSSEIAPIIVQAYELTEREREITQLVAVGASTAEMAERLFLSPHTVRDHLKAIFEKVGVSSRGELVAKLFAEHYAPVHLAPENGDWVNDSS